MDFLMGSDGVFDGFWWFLMGLMGFDGVFDGFLFSKIGCFCIYDSKETFQYVRMSVDEALVHDEETGSGGENLYENGTTCRPAAGPSAGLPTVLVFAPRADFKESEVQRLREAGQDLAGTLQCAFLELTRVVPTSAGGGPVGGHENGGESMTTSVQHREEVVLSYLKMLARDIQARSHIGRSIAEGCNLSELLDCDMRSVG